MPDRGPVGWLPPEARKKKKDFVNFLPDGENRLHVQCISTI